jgi:hypothetical protein
MTDESLTQRISALEEKMDKFLFEYNRNNNPTQQTFTKKCSFVGGVSFNGSSLGSVGDAMSVYGESPVAQAGTISAPSVPGAAYVQSEAQSAVNAINSIRNALQNFGITA